MENRLSKDVLRKHRDVVLANGQQLDLHDVKVFNYLLFKVYPRLLDGSIHRVPVSEVLRYVGHTSVARLGESLTSLGSVNIEIEYTDQNDERHLVKCHYLSFDLTKAEDGVLTFAFDPILLKFLWEPDVYTKINISFLQKFKTVYGVKLYEILSMYQNRKFNSSWEVSVDDFRKKLGVKDGSHPRFDNLKSQVIEKGILEVNKIAPFGVTVDYIRGGRGGKVIALRFNVVPREEVVDISYSQTINAGKKSRDPFTIEMFDGSTDSERGSIFIIKRDTYRDIEEFLVGNNISIDLLDSFEDEWRESISGRIVADPDSNFKKWITLKVESSQEDNLLSNVDDDIFGSLLEDFE